MESKVINLTLRNIYEEVMQYPNNISLYSGFAGNCLFRILYCKYLAHGELNVQLEQDIQKITDQYADLRLNTFANGKAGINWFYFQMYKLQLIEVEDLDELCLDDDELSSFAISILSKGNYDFLHGSLGIVYYLLERKPDATFFTKYFEQLKLLFSNRTDGMIGNFDLINNIIEQDKVNVGMAHGVVSILKFCLQCYEKGIGKKDSYELAQKIILYLINNQNGNKEISYFACFVVDNNRENQSSRLAWCYGDLSISYVLYQSAQIFHDQNLEKFALKVFYHSMNRKEENLTFVKDAGICHGASGIAHIYNKMWLKTNDLKFKRACDYWIERTLQFASHEDTTSGFKKYTPSIGEYQADQGMLEGTSGIGLVLLSYITGDFSWDYCLMLN